MTTTPALHPSAKAALDALASGDKTAWSALFTADAALFDDGAPQSLHAFTAEAVGHERFTHIERVENDGLDVEGQFHSDRWGDFRVYFKFRLAADGRISRLEIGQA
jgi:hypothetical protein